MRWSAAEIAGATRGRIVHGDPATVVERVTQDSRDFADAATLFIPLIAERDGHDFVAASGAAVSFTSRPASGLGAVPDSMVLIEVDDTERALGELGSAGRARLDGRPVIGITGSVGKTTTKDLLASVLAVDRSTHASHRSFNNEIGVPLTILNAPDSTEALVLEMGARGVGHIARLCGIGRPTIGVVTTVGVAHTSEFGSIEAVARAKGELVEALPDEADGGVAVLNAANPLVAAMAERTAARVVMFGSVDGSDAERIEGVVAVSAEAVSLDDDLVPRFRLVSEWGSIDVVLGARGLHLVDNALAAAAAALAAGVPLAAVAEGLASPILSPMRMALSRTPSGTAILDDSYNANPMSTEAALRSLAALPASRRVAVLGVMAELGTVSADEHARMGEVAAALGIEVIAVDAPDYLGRLDPGLGLGSGAHGAHGALAADIAEAMQLLVTPPAGMPIGPHDAVLVKGSRVAGLERLTELLLLR
jgi:UDP-N-acetylmuramoyl-tripeptide--D-alanyl-D-alanine ligase